MLKKFIMPINLHNTCFDVKAWITISVIATKWPKSTYKAILLEVGHDRTYVSLIHSLVLQYVSSITQQGGDKGENISSFSSSIMEFSGK